MEEITAIIQPHVLPKVMDALHALPHFPGITVSDVRGQGRGRGAGGHYVASKDTIFFREMTKLALFCADRTADELVRTIRAASHTSNPGDGMITVSDLPRIVRIRTGAEQEDAV
jgi:nitrogen regulatory protein P-II 1